MKMKLIRHCAISIAAASFVGSAFAQSSINAQRCQTLGQEVQAAFQASVQARVPKTDPTTFVQEGYDVKGIMSEDVTSGMSKLLSLDFRSIINNVVNRGLDRATQRATANFSQRLNGVLNGIGVQSVSFQATTAGVNINAPTFTNVVQGAANTAANGATSAVESRVNRAVGPYGRP
jgi:hypothetical protein